jgi:hypothetical protein
MLPTERLAERKREPYETSSGGRLGRHREAQRLRPSETYVSADFGSRLNAWTTFGPDKIAIIIIPKCQGKNLGNNSELNSKTENLGNLKNVF